MQELSTIKVDTYKALIIPSFIYLYNKKDLKKIYDVPEVRSTIKEFHLKKKLIVPVGLSAINLVN